MAKATFIIKENNIVLFYFLNRLYLLAQIGTQTMNSKLSTSSQQIIWLSHENEPVKITPTLPTCV